MTAASRSVRCSGTLRSLLLFFSLAFFFMAGPFVGVQAPRCSRVPTRTATFAFSSDQQRAGHCHKVWEVGSARQAYEWLVENRIEIPSSSGRSAVWRIPRYVNVLSMVKNPVYAGVYAYGRTKTMAQIESGQIRQIRQRQPRDNWLALIKDHHESYIELARFEQIQEMLKQNKQVRGNGTGEQRVG